MATPPSTSSRSARKTLARSLAARDASSAACVPSSKPPLHARASASISTSSDFLVVAHVLTAHGVHGELKCRIITDFPSRRFKRGTRLYLGVEHQPVTVVRARVQGDTALLQLEEVSDRSAAEKLRDFELSIPVAEAGRPPKGEFF